MELAELAPPLHYLQRKQQLRERVVLVEERQTRACAQIYENLDSRTSVWLARGQTLRQLPGHARLPGE